ncbi:hypothetical protein L3Y34_007095 [Caenorhabditis briggsae]|uniref:Nuclear receptor domain-containing protein n=1 Tax=Caenorhabditis briggsae TaxID=6238 RepID=A0AAE9A0Y0_CAEBR|nr:hypothetical protein L3Y34_007095 [Caenorhabditis briggsae]
MSVSPSSPDICAVCGGLPNGRRYGPITCLGCIVFFRRAVQDDKLGKCEKDCLYKNIRDLKFICRSCRLQRCLIAGMNPDAIRLRDKLGPRRPKQTQMDSCSLKTDRDLTSLLVLQKKQRNLHKRYCKPKLNVSETLIMIKQKLYRRASSYDIELVLKIVLILLTASSENYIKAITFRVLRSLGIMSAERKVYEDHNRYLSSNLAASSRLGNHIFELSALLAMSRKLERIPTFFIQDNWHDLMLQDTDILIPGLVDHFLIINETVPASVVPVDFHMVCCIFDDPEKLKNNTDQYLHIKGTHFQSWKYFPRMRNELIGYLKKPTNMHPDLPKSDYLNFLTCIHIRRTDFVGTGSHVPEIDFILSAMKYVEDREKRKGMRMLTVFFGDDISYLESLQNETFVLKTNRVKNLKTESFISKDSPSDSLLFSRHHCDVVMFTAPHSTFGWWMGYFSKGNQVYYTDIRYTNDTAIPQGVLIQDDYFPPHWIPVRYNSRDNATVHETL